MILGKRALFLNWKSKQLDISENELALGVIAGIPDLGHGIMLHSRRGANL
jgi:hypothetical protein